VRVGEVRALGHEDDVAEEREGRAEPDGGAVDAGDDRLLALEKGGDDALRVQARARPFVRALEHALEPLEVAARAFMSSPG